MWTTLTFAVATLGTSRLLSSTYALQPSVGDLAGDGLQWSSCPDHDTLSCAYFNIPLDYHNSSAGNGQLLVVKANATAATAKKGTIFLNPGGPGVSGLQALVDDTEALMARTGGAYDFVSWDPRGVGPYTYPGNVFCLSDEEYNEFWGDTVEATGINWLGDFTNQTDLQALYDQASVLDAKYKNFGEKCLQGPNATTLQYVGTAATVRDLVGLADAIQGPDTPIFYWGLSYGTLVGAWFMNMFPERVGRVILDGVLDATRIASTQSYHLWRDQVTSSEDVYSALANACAMAGPQGCKLAPFEGASGADVVKNISDTIELAHAHPSAGQLRSLRATIYGSLYQPQMWAEYANTVLPEAIASINGSDAKSTTQRRAHSLDKRAVFSQNSYTEPAVVCADSVDADPSVTMQTLFDEVVGVTRDVSHTFGAFWPIPWYRCSYWPVRAPERYQGPFNGTYANRILVIGNSHDNATPFVAAQHMAEVMGDQAALVRQDGFGHTSIYQSSACVTDIITAYFEDGTLPAGTASAPTVCAIDASVEIFPGVKSTDVSANGTLADRK
ncbi:alpha/beta-hydrolase [Daedaleopsis nitida]|nr:alpha/beta-hydrolase [Daedaleopsis nitida]